MNSGDVESNGDWIGIGDGEGSPTSGVSGGCAAQVTHLYRRFPTTPWRAGGRPGLALGGWRACTLQLRLCDQVLLAVMRWRPNADMLQHEGWLLVRQSGIGGGRGDAGLGAGTNSPSTGAASNGWLQLVTPTPQSVCLPSAPRRELYPSATCSRRHGVFGKGPMLLSSQEPDEGPASPICIGMGVGWGSWAAEKGQRWKGC